MAIDNYILLLFCFIAMSETVNFIDFDFCAYNYQAYDIARHFCDYAGDDAFLFYL